MWRTHPQPPLFSKERGLGGELQSMSQNLLQQFRTERARRFDEVARKLLESQEVDAGKKYLEWVETSTKLFAPTQQAVRRTWSLVVLALCIVLVGLAWTLRIWFTHVALDVTAGNVVLTLSQDWTCDQQFAAEKVFIDNLAWIEAPGLNLTNAADQQPGWIELQGRGIRLEEFTLAAGAEIELSVQQGEVFLFVKRSALSGTLQVKQAKLSLANGEEQEIAVDIPETLAFQTAQAGAAPIQLRLATKEPWRLRGLQAQRLRFVEEYPPDSGKFVSVIQSGKVTLLETGLEKELRATDYLTLHQPRTTRLELSNADNGVSVLFEGAAAKIETGSQDFQDNLTPTWFAYIARQKRLTVFWSAVVFLSGLVWKIRETLVG